MEGIVSAACYIRVSTEDQTEYSPDAQRKAMEAYAAQHGMTILPNHVYIDAGISGRRASTRPAFMAMIAAAKQDPPPFSVILVHKFDRFARNREDSIVYKSMLRRQCGVQVISITERLEDDRMGLILEAMLEAMAEYYSVNLADEVRKGMAEKARRGELQTSPPFGYRAEENRLVPVSEEAAFIRELFQRYEGGESIASLARLARERGILSHRGNLLDSRGVRYILSNPVYIGKLRWGIGEEKGRAAYPGEHEPLIEKESFLHVQTMLEENRSRHGKHPRPDGDRRHWLAGLVKCSVCSGGLIFSQAKYLRCGRYVKGKCAASQHISADRLEEALLEQLRKDAGVEAALLVLPLEKKREEDAADLDRQISALEKKLIRLREAYLCGAETAQEYRIEKERISAERDRLRKLRQELQKDDCAETMGTVRRFTGELMPDSNASIADKYRAADAILKRCVWDKRTGRLTLTYRWSPDAEKNVENQGKTSKIALET